MSFVKKYWKRLLIVLAVLLVAAGAVTYFALRKNPIPDPPFTAKTYDNGFCSFQVPENWELYIPAKTKAAEPQPDPEGTQDDGDGSTAQPSDDTSDTASIEPADTGENTESTASSEAAESIEGHREEGMPTGDDSTQGDSSDEEQSASTEQMTFILSGADTSVSVSNINVNISKIAGKKSSIKKMYAEFEDSFEKTVTDLYPNASDFSFSDYEAPNHKVFQTHYTLTTESTTAKCVQYYPLIKDYVLVITTTDIGDDTGKQVQAIAEHLINTFEFVD